MLLPRHLGVGAEHVAEQLQLRAAEPLALGGRLTHGAVVFDQQHVVAVGPGLLRLDDDLYVVDKQQGHIFKFDPEFRPVSRQCGFGRGPGRLFDPIVIHPAPDGTRLQVMNWVPGSIVTVPRF